MSHRELRSFLVTSDEATKIADVSLDVIHQWSSRGYLTRYGSPRNALWDWRELAACKNAKRGQRRRVA